MLPMQGSCSHAKIVSGMSREPSQLTAPRHTLVLTIIYSDKMKGTFEMIILYNDRCRPLPLLSRHSPRPGDARETSKILILHASGDASGCSPSPSFSSHPVSAPREAPSLSAFVVNVVGCICMRGRAMGM